MKRRTAIKQVAFTLGGLMTLPIWAKAWSATDVQSQPFLTATQDTLLAELVETVIPETNTPGAKSLGVHQLIQTIVADCYAKPEQEKLKQGILSADQLANQLHGKGFIACDVNQRLAVLKAMESSSDNAQKEFYGLLRGLTINGYMKSEYYLTNIAKFEFAPGHFYGCVPVKK